jgi:hypothetical protein
VKIGFVCSIRRSASIWVHPPKISAEFVKIMRRLASFETFHELEARPYAAILAGLASFGASGGPGQDTELPKWQSWLRSRSFIAVKPLLRESK